MLNKNEDLSWFKFSPKDWLAGSIQKQTANVQASFINLVCKYWIERCVMTITEAGERVGIQSIKELLKKKLITKAGASIHIKFLDEQLERIEAISEARRQAVASRWQRRTDTIVDANAIQNDTIVSDENIQTDTSVIQNDTEKNKKRTEKNKKRIRKEKNRKEGPPVAAPFHGEVLDVWNEWLEYRRQRNATCTPLTLKRQITFLTGRDDDVIKEILSTSITNGWTGLFEPKSNYHGNGNNTKESNRGIDTGIQPGGSWGKKTF